MTDAHAPMPEEKIFQRLAEQRGLDERAIRFEVVRMIMAHGPGVPRPMEMAKALTHYILTGETLRPAAEREADAVAAAPFTDAQEERAAQIARNVVADVARGADERIRDFVSSALEGTAR